MPTLQGGDNRDVTSQDVLKLLSGEITPDDIRERRRQQAKRRREGYLQHLREQELEKLSTRALLDMLRHNRSYDPEYMTPQQQMVARIEWWALRKVLSRRPHVRRGEEAKRHRREAAAKHRGQGKSKNR